MRFVIVSLVILGAFSACVRAAILPREAGEVIRWLAQAYVRQGR